MQTTHGYAEPMKTPPTFKVRPTVGAISTQQTCPFCQAVIVTKTENKSTVKTCLIVLMVCLPCLWPCACCVFFSKSCRSVEYSCPNCDG